MKTAPILMFIFIAAVLFFTPVYAMEESKAADIRIIKISPTDQKAVIQISGKDLLVIKAGDKLDGIGKVVEILGSSIRLEVQAISGPETLIISFDGDKQQIQRIRKSAPPMPTHHIVSTALKMSGDGKLKTASETNP